MGYKIIIYLIVHMMIWDLISLPIDHFPRQQHHLISIQNKEITSFMHTPCPILKIFKKIFKQNMQNQIVAAFALKDSSTVLEYNTGARTKIIDFLASAKIEIIEDIKPNEPKCALIHLQLWTSPFKADGYAFGYLCLHPYRRNPCIILDIRSSGKALIAVQLLKTTVDEKKKQQLMDAVCHNQRIVKKIGFRPDDASIICELFQDHAIYKEFEILTVDMSFLYVRTPILPDELAIFRGKFQPRGSKFSYELEPFPSLCYQGPDIEDVMITETPETDLVPTSTSSSPSDLVMALEHGSSRTKNASDNEFESEEIHSPKSSSSEDDTDSDFESDETDNEENGNEFDEKESHGPLKIEAHKFSSKRSYSNHYDNVNMPKVMQLIKDNKPGHTKQIKELIGHLSSSTYYRWKNKLIENPEYIPQRSECGHQNKILPDDLEVKILERIDNDFIENQLLFTDAHCHHIALEEYHKALENGVEFKKPFKASLKWVRTFRKQFMISLRKPHLRRRAEPNKKLIAAYLDRFSKAEAKYDPRYIVNSDETNWPVVMSPKKIWSQKSDLKSAQKETRGVINGDSKLSFTIMAAINMAGEGLPLYMIAKGKTELCERQLNAHGKTKLDHSESGWVTVNVMQRYFEFLRFTVDQKYGLKEKNRVLLVLDMYAAHRNKDLLKDAATRLGIDLVFVPPGMTGELQPLDVAIFGALKSAGQSAWIQSYIENPDQKFDRTKASESAQTCWENVSTDQIKKAWSKIKVNGRLLLADKRLTKDDENEETPTATTPESSEFIPEEE
jgi:transposase